LFSSAAFAVAWFMEREPEFPGAWQHTRQAEYKTATLYCTWNNFNKNPPPLTSNIGPYSKSNNSALNDTSHALITTMLIVQK
jgi:hypothetical protein